jgi:hypothetical protein
MGQKTMHIACPDWKFSNTIQFVLFASNFKVALGPTKVSQNQLLLEDSIHTEVFGERKTLYLLFTFFQSSYFSMTFSFLSDKVLKDHTLHRSNDQKSILCHSNLCTKWFYPSFKFLVMFGS